MTYNHDKAKVTCPDCAREVERLERENSWLNDCIYTLQREVEELKASHPQEKLKEAMLEALERQNNDNKTPQMDI